MAVCKGCGLQACTWDRQDGKLRLLEPNGERHRCQFYRRKKREYTGPLTKKGETTIGKDYRLGCCTVCPPWEDCKHEASATQAPTPAERINAEADERWNHFLDLIAQP